MTAEESKPPATKKPSPKEPPRIGNPPSGDRSRSDLDEMYRQEAARNKKKANDEE